MPMQIALEVAEHAGLPLMAHLDGPPPPRAEVMKLLRQGRHPHPLLPPVPQRAGRAGRQRRRRRAGGARARRDLRHRPWPRLVRLRDRDGDAEARLPARRDLVATSTSPRSTAPPSTCSSRCRNSFDWACRCRKSSAPARSTPPARFGCDDRGTLKPGLLGDATVSGDRARQVHLHATCSARRMDADEQHCLPRHRARRQMVARLTVPPHSYAFSKPSRTANA